MQSLNWSVGLRDSIPPNGESQRKENGNWDYIGDFRGYSLNYKKKKQEERAREGRRERERER